MEGQWAAEKWSNMETHYKITKELDSEETPFQSMQFVETEMFGKMLLLDGIVQTTERDEFVYHEMMTHVPICSHPNPKKVLVIGGGDGGILREALRHKSVERAVLAEIDAGVIEFSKKHLPTLSAGAFDDERVEIVIGDGAKFVAETDEKFDIVIVDSCDPIGPATVLFSREFYSNIARIMPEDGIMVRQTGSSFVQPGEVGETCELMQGIFRYCGVYAYNVPTYVGGLFTTVFCSNAVDPLAECDVKKQEKKFGPLADACRYYNPGVHFGSFQLPGYLKDLCSKAGK